MAFWLSRFTTTAQGIVPVVARDQYLLENTVEPWSEFSDPDAPPLQPPG